MFKLGVDLEKFGKEFGFVDIPYSVSRSAYGNIRIPMCVVRNGSGPTVLFTAGNHGDEYEGQIALRRLAETLDPHRVQGRVIIIPALNLPAALAGQRVSPLDDGNLNRMFPGEIYGTVTQQIAHFVDSCLFPVVDYSHDLHSGGQSLDYVGPFATFRNTAGPDLAAKSFEALKAFGAPVNIVWDTGDNPTLFDDAAHRHGVVALGGEFGGGGRLSLEALHVVERGIMRLLAFAGVVDLPVPPVEEMEILFVPDRSYYAYADDAGVFEQAFKLGDWVERGQLCGHVHFVDDFHRAPKPVYFEQSGVVICMRSFARVMPGDCVAHLAVREDRSRFSLSHTSDR